MESTNQNYQEEAKYVILTQKIISNKQLTVADRLVLARISGFARFYESNEATAEFLGLGATTVAKAKQKLARLNYIVEVGNTGRGKIYAPNLHQIPIRQAEFANQMSKNCQSDEQNLPTENKKRIKREYKGDESVAEGVENSKKQEYGREDINELVELWQAETGIDIKGQQNQRRQLYNLLRKYGADGTKALVKRVGNAIRSGDRFAPQIATPSDLTGKYSKLAKLDMWETRNATARPFGQGSAPQDEQPLPSYLAINGFENWPPEPEYSDEEHARVCQMFKDARKTLPFLQKKGDQK